MACVKFLFVALIFVDLSQAQLAFHLLYPLQNYLKSLPPLKFQQLSTVPVDVNLYTPSAATVEKETLIKGSKKTLGTSKNTQATTTLETTSTIALTTLTTEGSTTPEFEEIGVLTADRRAPNQQQAGLNKQERVNQQQPVTNQQPESNQHQSNNNAPNGQNEVTNLREKQKQMVETQVGNTQPETRMEKEVQQSSSSIGTSTPVETVPPTSTEEPSQITTDRLARFRPKVKGESEAHSESRVGAGKGKPDTRDFLKSIPRVKFVEQKEESENIVRPGNGNHIV